MATIQEIADLAGVSRGTVDRALNHRGRINPEVAKKIREIAKELNYEVKSRAKQAADKKKGMKLGLITQLSDSPFMVEVNRGIRRAETEFREDGITLIVKDIPTVDEQLQAKAIDELVAAGVAGIAMMPVDTDLIREKVNGAVDLNIPVVTFNSDIVGTRRSCFIGLDNRRSGFTAAGLMGMLLRNREKSKILIITGSFSNSVNSLRVDGFIEVIKRDYPQVQLMGVQSSFDDTVEVEKIIRDALSSAPDLAGVFVVSSGQEGIHRALLGVEPEKRPFVIAYDMTPENGILLEEGYVDLIIDQEGYLQGYNSLKMLLDILLKRVTDIEDSIYTDIKIKTRYNM